jgi:hypothetical protein
MDKYDTTDILHRLKAQARTAQVEGRFVLANTLTLAVAEIDRLRAEIERLKRISAEVSHVCGHDDY